MRLDLPTFERPRKEISGIPSRGQSCSAKALLRNSVVIIFIGPGRGVEFIKGHSESLPRKAKAAACGHVAAFEIEVRCELLSRGCGGTLFPHGCKALHALTHRFKLRLDVRNSLDQAFEVFQEVRIAEHRSQF